MYLLKNPIRDYAWGSTTAIAELLGKESPSPRPEAELWMGAHPNAPSLVEKDGVWRSLIEVIAADPAAELGEPVVVRFGPSLPFLFKVLAAKAPLSLQAHPDLAQARAGFEADERARIPLDAPHRNYKDRNHKPELLCALGPFEVLCGFRRVEHTLRLFEALAIEPLAAPLAALAREPDAKGLAQFFAWLMSADEALRPRLVRATLDGCRRHQRAGGEFARECGWALRLGQAYGDDVGVTVALLLNLMELAPGQAIYLPAGNLHAYLEGVGVEIMANSDNVLRGGLTPKHVDIPELLRVLSFEDGPVACIGPSRGEGAEHAYPTPAAEFRLARVDLAEGAFRAAARRGPEILLCTDGGANVRSEGRSRALSKGDSIFVSASDGPYEASGTGTLFRATVGDG